MIIYFETGHMPRYNYAAEIFGQPRINSGRASSAHGDDMKGRFLCQLRYISAGFADFELAIERYYDSRRLYSSLSAMLACIDGDFARR